MSAYAVRVSKDYLVFCAGHFITYGGQCETLHGHNYRVAVSLHGVPDENHYVFDFVTLKRLSQTQCDRLDHRMLLPTENEHLRLEIDAERVVVRFQSKIYCFPKEDVVMLPVPNTTAEMLARYIAQQLRNDPLLAQVTNLSAIQVEVEESFGQSASYREAW